LDGNCFRASPDYKNLIAKNNQKKNKKERKREKTNLDVKTPPNATKGD